MRKTSLLALPFYLGLAQFAPISNPLALAQPQLKVGATNNKKAAADKITFPAQFSLPEFFALTSQSTSTRIIAPANDKDDRLKQLNEALSNRQVTAEEAFKEYSLLYGTSGYGRPLSLSIVEGPFPGSSQQAIKNAQEELERTTQAWDFIVSLSKDQVTQMYSEGYLSADSLTPEQKPAYIKLMRKYGLIPSIETLSDKQLLAQPFKFNFYLTASFTVQRTNKEETSWIGMYDYGTGLIWNPLAPAATNPLPIKEAQLEATPPKPLLLTTTVTPTVEFSTTHVWTIREALDTIQQKSGKKVVIAKDLPAEKLQQTHVVLTKGSYSLEELMDGVPATIGAELRPRNNVLYMRQTSIGGQIERHGRLKDQLARVEKTLQRLPAPSSVLPFFSSTFEKRSTLPYSQLDSSQKTYIQARLVNEEPDKYANFDLSKTNVLFAKTLWFSGFYNKPGSAMITTNYQIW